MNFDLTEIFKSNLFYILIGISIFLFIQSLILFYSGPIKARLDLNKRLRSTIVNDLQERALDELLKSRGLNQGSQLRYPLMRSINELIVKSGSTLGVVPIILGSLGLILFVSLILWVLGYNVFLACLIGFLVGIFFPIFALNFMSRRRIAKFGDQLPDAISMIARSLRVGHPLPVAIRMVGREMSDPIGSEFSIVSSELAAGLSLDQAIKNLEGRVGQDDLPMLVASIVIQSDTGGNLGEILNVLSNIIRNRVKLRRKVRALTSEGRISARALSALPFILYLVLMFTAPTYYGIAWSDEMTKFALGAGALWMVVGNFVMMNMVNIKY